MTAHLTVIVGGRDDTWMEHGNCRGISNPSVFCPREGASHKQAKAICSDCPVRSECLEHALVHNERFGVWGGLSGRERERIRKVRKAGGL